MLQSCISCPWSQCLFVQSCWIIFNNNTTLLMALKVLVDLVGVSLYSPDHMIPTAWCKILLPLMRNTDNVPRQVVTFAVNYTFDLFTGLRHPPALPLTAAEFVSLLQTATPTQVIQLL